MITNNSSSQRLVLAELTAGDAREIVVEQGTAVRIMTGTPVAPGADAVAMVEYVEERDGLITLTKPVDPGANINRAGQDVKKGQLVLSAGTVLGAPEVGLLAALGQRSVEVHRRPTVAVLSTGDELVEPWEEAGPAKIQRQQPLRADGSRGGGGRNRPDAGHGQGRPVRAAGEDPPGAGHCGRSRHLWRGLDGCAGSA